MTYRPDEMANLAEIERDSKARSMLKKGTGIAASFGAGLVYGPLAQKILPYLSGVVPLDLAMKAIQKFSPKTADFLNKGRDMGLDIQEGMEFVKEKLTPKDTKAQSLFRRLVGDVDFSKLDEKTTKELSFLEKISAQLEEKGKDEKDPGVKKLKKKIEKVLKGITGIADAEMMQENQAIPQDQEIFYDYKQPSQPGQQQQQMQQQSQSQQIGPGQQALMAILQKIQASRGLGG